MNAVKDFGKHDNSDKVTNVPEHIVQRMLDSEKHLQANGGYVGSEVSAHLKARAEQLRDQ